MVWKPEIDELNRRNTMAEKMGGEVGVNVQHERGKLITMASWSMSSRPIRSLVSADSMAARLCSTAVILQFAEAPVMQPSETNPGMHKTWREIIDCPTFGYLMPVVAA